MQHRQFRIQQLTASGRVISSRGGNLMVARRSDNPNLDWELVHQSTEIEHIDKAPYRLDMSGPEGSFSGDAVLVRSDGTSHVFRGAGDLDGFDSF